MTATEFTRKGFFREVDGTAVSQAEALRIWAPIAVDELISTAHTYDAVVTYKELALRVQDVSGVRTTQLIMHWIGRLLDQVITISDGRGEPPLTALCVRADGTVGDGYAGVAVAGGPKEQLAAQERLLCYRRYAKDLPADGGKPNVTPFSARHQRTKTPSPVREDLVCPNCFMILPMSKACDACEWTPSG